MSSFTQEQVAFFRQTFSQFSDPASGTVNRESFAVAVATCWEGGNVGGSVPSPHRLSEEFDRISGGSGELQWQQFFQVSTLGIVNFTSLFFILSGFIIFILRFY